MMINNKKCSVAVVDYYVIAKVLCNLNTKVQQILFMSFLDHDVSKGVKNNYILNFRIIRTY